MKLARVFNLTHGRCSADFKSFYEVLSSRDGSLLGLDVGTRHVGVSVCDAGRHVAFPAFSYVRSHRIEDDRLAVHKQLRVMDAVGVVVGMPHVNAPLQKFITSYAAMLLDGYEDIEAVAFWDERYTSVISNDKMMQAAKRSHRRDARMRKNIIDQGAAAEILQETLDAIKIHSEELQAQGCEDVIHLGTHHAVTTKAEV